MFWDDYKVSELLVMMNCIGKDNFDMNVIVFEVNKQVYSILYIYLLVELNIL